MSATEFLMKMLADAAGTPVDLLNLIGTTPVNAGRNFSAVLKGEKIPEPLDKLVETGSSEDLRKRMGVSTEDSLTEIVGMLLAPSVAGKATALPLLMGAFRNANDSMISQTMLNMLKGGKHESALDRSRMYNEQFYDTDLVLQTLANKLSDKELKKYGTPEFLLDRYLPSTINAERYGTSPVPSTVYPGDEYSLARDMKHLSALNESRAKIIKQGEADLPVRGVSNAKTKDDLLVNHINNYSGTKNIQDMLDAKKAGKTLYLSDDIYSMEREIASGLRGLLGQARDMGIPEGDIAKKSIEQLTSVIKKKEDEALKALRKSEKVKISKFKDRTAELMQSQKAEKLPGGFVKLEDSTDLSHETAMMNHCIGAVCRDNDRYIPMHDPVTGGFTKEGQKVFDNRTYVHTSFNQYNNALGDGTSEFFSYRPDGLAEFTVELSIDPRGVRRLKQAYGPEDSELTTQQKLRLQELLDNRGVTRELGW